MKNRSASSILSGLRRSRHNSIARRLPWICIGLIILWFHILYEGERSLFASHVAACRWDNWEKWPAHAKPHHLVLVADPQLVDPHTYPGRPWPLSSLTETYADQYMSRNFKLINSDLDPDSIVFLGDLFDGGREWSTGSKRASRVAKKKETRNVGAGSNRVQRRDEKSDEAAQVSPHTGLISRSDHFLEDPHRDPNVFVHGENGRWKAWGPGQWNIDYRRFSRIFFRNSQLYPAADRTWHINAPGANVIGTDAKGIDRQELSLSGGKQRRVIWSLPGNHDLGFGELVQISVRERFQSRFGRTNQINVIGNHTIVNLDTPSLSAMSQWRSDGNQETNADQAADLEYIWRPTMNFLDNITIPTRHATDGALTELFPKQAERDLWPHQVNRPGASASKEATSNGNAQLPIILLTHVPMHRESDVDCGVQRERGHSISISAGYQYQNVVTRSLSTTIVGKVSAAGDIVHIFSGDDHDYCEVQHRYNTATRGGVKTRLPVTVPEITVKSFSWAMGVRKPGFLLVSMYNPINAEGRSTESLLSTIQTYNCLLPDQLGTFIRYALMFGVTLITLSIRAIWRAVHRAESSTDEDSTLLFDVKVIKWFGRGRDSAGNGHTVLSAKKSSKNRQRASSTSTSHGSSTDKFLSVQRNLNARTRSVSPAHGFGYALPTFQSMHGDHISKTHSYPDLRWQDPDDSDEESQVGSEMDSQEKWRRRRRRKSRTQVASEEFLYSVILVGIPVFTWYWHLLKEV